MSRLFYAAPAAWGGDRITLDQDETRHLRVLRLAPGADIRVMDGAGKVAACVLSSIGKRGSVARVESVEEFSRPISRAVIALAFSKAARRGFFLEKAVELGCAGIWIWQAKNSQGHPASNFAASARGQLIAGAKQCANPWLPDVAVLSGVAEVVALSEKADYRILPYEQQEGQPPLGQAELGRPGTTVYVIGPEGGFTVEEVGALRGAGFLPVSLGPRVLRCETAAVLCLGLHYWATWA